MSQGVAASSNLFDHALVGKRKEETEPSSTADRGVVRKGMRKIIRVFLAGCLAVLPLAITIFAIGFVFSFLMSFVGPDTVFGRILASVGEVIGVPVPPYLTGITVFLFAIFGLGLIVESRLGPWLIRVLESIVVRVPLISQVYAFSKRFTSIVEARDSESLMNMTPVWCVFGSEPGATVLALRTSTKPVVIGGGELVSIIVPSAPVPIGGALVYVPASWIRPFDGGVEQLMSVYVSMGVKPPLPARGQLEADGRADQLVRLPADTPNT